MRNFISPRREKISLDAVEVFREDVVGRSSIVFFCKAAVDETFSRRATNKCKFVVWIDAGPLYLYWSTLCQLEPEGLYTRWVISSETKNFTLWRNRPRCSENLVKSYHQRNLPDYKIEKFHTTGKQKRVDCFGDDGFCSHCNTVFEAMGRFHYFGPCQDIFPPLTEEDLNCSPKKRELDELRRKNQQKTDCYVIDK